MKSLSKNWMTEGLIDFEYKKYQLMAYLQETDRQFRATRLYPVLGELIEHHRHLHEFRSGKKKLNELFPKSLTHVDLSKAQLHYRPLESEGEIVSEINQITDFALPRLEKKIKEGRSIYDYVEEHVEFEPVGIQPIYRREGFVLLTQEQSSDIHAYRYRSGLLQIAGERFRSVSLWLIGVFQKTLIKTLETLKLELIREIKELPNPATWRLHSKQSFPIDETLVPIGKRLLLQHVKE